MKTINEMTMNELAACVVTLGGWDQDMAGIQWALYRAKVEGQHDLEPMFLPNLNSPATLGCLLAMVRKKHGSGTCTAYTLDGWKVTKPRTKANSRAKTGAAGWRLVNAWDRMRTEAHALVAALAKDAS